MGIPTWVRFRYSKRSRTWHLFDHLCHSMSEARRCAQAVRELHGPDVVIVLDRA